MWKMFRIVLLVIVLAQREPLAASQGVVCPTGFQNVHGSCYWVSITPTTWKAATVICQSHNAHLADFSTDDEIVPVMLHAVIPKSASFKYRELWTLFILVFIVLFQKTNSGTICLSCNNLAEGELCTGNEVCKNDEVCFIQKYTTNGNENRYDVGCAYPELCQKDLTVHVFGRRSDHSHVLCHKCCNNTDVCNAHLSCNDKISVPMQKCLSCSEIEDPKMCKNETTCAKDEICYLHKYTTHTKQQLFDVGCKHSSLCTQGYSNILGRRSSDGVHQECESCCSGAVFCNHDLQCNHVPLKIINNTCSTTNECIGNLVCLNGTCKCQSEQFYWGVKTCYKRQNVSERCTSDHQCKQSLSCEQNICKCVVNKFWNGSLCEPKKTFHSTCSSSDECLDTLYCNHGYCKCDASVDYWNGSSCLTGKLYNESCSNSVKCQGTFRCINNKCSCLSSEYLEGSQCLTRKLFNESCSNSVKCQGTFRCINNKCSCLSSEYLEGSQCLTKKLECEDVEGSHDGVYTIYPGGGDMAVTVYCIMRQAKKWTVIQRRVNGSVDFYRTWHEYKKGFGSVYGEYWLGNDNINIISTNGFHELSIYMEQSNLHRMANYSNFIVDNERNKYRLTVTGYSGDAGDSMNPVDDREKSNGQPFTTKDRDNDDNSNNCAVSHRSAWWYANCFGSELNRPYSGSAGTMYWVTWRSDISKSIVMIRRKS